MLEQRYIPEKGSDSEKKRRQTKMRSTIIRAAVHGFQAVSIPQTYIQLSSVHSLDLPLLRRDEREQEEYVFPGSTFFLGHISD